MSRGVWAWLVRKLTPSPKTPPYEVIELEKGVTAPSRDDAEAIASLKHHPGMEALLNRLRFQRSVFENKLRTVKHENLRDVDCLQFSISWSRLMELEIANAVGYVSSKAKSRAATFDEIKEFERVRAAIESVGITSPE